MPPLIEACVHSAESAVAAAGGGAGRVELCANLVEGGTTPSAGAIELTKQRLDIPVMVMIRPRGGDFHYTRLERHVMLRDVEVAIGAGADGLVFGALQPSGEIDMEFTRQLVEATGGRPVSFHRAFDLCLDPFEALEALVDLGVDRVLTSGQQPTVPEGLALIEELAKRASGRIGILPGGGIRPDNVASVLAIPGIEEAHVYAATDFASPMTHRNPSLIMGRAYEPDEYLRTEVSEVGIREIVEAARS
jgi:copper homeostasis protein